MGEIADMLIDQMLDDMFYHEPPIRHVGEYEWLTREGKVMDMWKMEERHLRNSYYLAIRNGSKKVNELRHVLDHHGFKYDPNYKDSAAVTRSNIIDLNLHLFWETEKAIKVGLTEDEDEHVWLPKAWIEWTQTGPESCEVSISENKALEKGLI